MAPKGDFTLTILLIGMHFQRAYFVFSNQGQLFECDVVNGRENRMWQLGFTSLCRGYDAGFKPSSFLIKFRRQILANEMTINKWGEKIFTFHEIFNFLIKLFFLYRDEYYFNKRMNKIMQMNFSWFIFLFK